MTSPYSFRNSFKKPPGGLPPAWCLQDLSGSVWAVSRGGCLLCRSFKKVWFRFIPFGNVCSVKYKNLKRVQKFLSSVCSQQTSRGINTLIKTCLSRRADRRPFSVCPRSGRWSPIGRPAPGGSVRKPCPALSSSGWLWLSGRWANQSDQPLHDKKHISAAAAFRSSLTKPQVNTHL